MADLNGNLKPGGYYVSRIDDAHSRISGMEKELKHYATKNYVLGVLGSAIVGSSIVIGAVITNDTVLAVRLTA